MQEDYKVGERIRQIREGLNMNREKFSEMIDISSVFRANRTWRKVFKYKNFI